MVWWLMQGLPSLSPSLSTCNSELIAAPDTHISAEKASLFFLKCSPTIQPPLVPTWQAGLAGRLGWLCLLGTHMHTEAHAWLCTRMRTHTPHARAMPGLATGHHERRYLPSH